MIDEETQLEDETAGKVEAPKPKPRTKTPKPADEPQPEQPPFGVTIRSPAPRVQD